MNTLIAIYLFLIGAACGSFALVLADRLHAGRDWVRGRSACDACGQQLGVRDLIPIVSWLLQRGKCRYCSESLSAYYPLVELGMGAAFVVSYVWFPFELTSAHIALFGLWLIGLVIMAALVVSDFKWFLLPSKLVYPLIYVGVFHWLIRTYTQVTQVNTTTGQGQSLGSGLLGLGGALVVSAGLFWALHVYSKGTWIGDGDYRLGVAMAFFLGSPLTAWMALFFASVLGLLSAAPQMIKSKDRRTIKIPYGPFLIAGLFVSYLYGQQLIDWYTDAFLFL